jgi:hypothetical protein
MRGRSPDRNSAPSKIVEGGSRLRRLCLYNRLPVPLTTIRFPIEPFALVCYERLLKQMKNPSVPDPGLTLIDSQLIVRASTGGGAANCHA